MRLVPLHKLLLQPRVHLQWILQARALSFEVGQPLAERFATLWHQYEAAGYPPPAEFLSWHPLAEQDYLFALFAGAVYLHEHLPHFQVDITNASVIWRGEGDAVKRAEV